MSSETHGSVTQWLGEIRDGDSLAAEQLWKRYFAQLVGVAQHRVRIPKAHVDGEDIALSALKSVMLGLQMERFPDLHDRTGLWPLLVAITARKSIDHVKRETALKRGGGSTETLGDFIDLFASDPDPAFAAEVADELEYRIEALPDEVLKRIARLKLEESTNHQIAEKLGCTVRTVVRKLKRIQQEWDNDDQESEQSDR